jgi:hypothetical protein
VKSSLPATEETGAMGREIESRQDIGCRVARWYIFKPKIQFWIIFGGSCNVIIWYILWIFGIFYGHFLYLYGH